MSSCSLVFLCSKEEVQIDELLSNLPKIEQGKILIIDGDTEVAEPCMFQRGMHLLVCYCLCYVMDISADMLEEQVSEERDPDLIED